MLKKILLAVFIITLVPSAYAFQLNGTQFSITTAPQNTTQVAINITYGSNESLNFDYLKQVAMTQELSNPQALGNNTSARILTLGITPSKYKAPGTYHNFIIISNSTAFKIANVSITITEVQNITWAENFTNKTMVVQQGGNYTITATASNNGNTPQNVSFDIFSLPSGFEISGTTKNLLSPAQEVIFSPTLSVGSKTGLGLYVINTSLGNFKVNVTPIIDNQSPELVNFVIPYNLTALVPFNCLFTFYDNVNVTRAWVRMYDENGSDIKLATNDSQHFSVSLTYNKSGEQKLYLYARDGANNTYKREFLLRFKGYTLKNPIRNELDFGHITPDYLKKQTLTNFSVEMPVKVKLVDASFTGNNSSSRYFVELLNGGTTFDLTKGEWIPLTLSGAVQIAFKSTARGNFTGTLVMELPESMENPEKKISLTAKVGDYELPEDWSGFIYGVPTNCTIHDTGDLATTTYDCIMKYDPKMVKSAEDLTVCMSRQTAEAKLALKDREINSWVDKARTNHRLAIAGVTLFLIAILIFMVFTYVRDRGFQFDIGSLVG